MVLSDRSGFNLDFRNDCRGRLGCHRIICLDDFGLPLQRGIDLPHTFSHCATTTRFRQGMDLDFHRNHPLYWSDLDDHLALSAQRAGIEA